MFPNDTVTYSNEVCGPQDLNVYTGGDNTILGVAMQQSNISSDTTVLCGNDPVAKNYATNYSHVPLNYQCEDNIKISKTGNDCAFVIINYTPYMTSDYSTTTQYGYNPPIGITSSSSVNIYGSFTAGELFIGLLLVLHLLFTFIYTVVKSYGGFKTKKSYIDYGRGQVPNIEEL